MIIHRMGDGMPMPINLSCCFKYFQKLLCAGKPLGEVKKTFVDYLLKALTCFVLFYAVIFVLLTPFLIR